MSMKTVRSNSGLSRRAFLAGAFATGAALALTGCGEKEETTATEEASTEETAEEPVEEAQTEAAADEPVSGGTLKWYVNSPKYIEPYNVQEDQGMQVCNCLFDALTVYDYDTNQLVGCAATSWEANDDATQFTFHLREGATFHNGDPVTSADFEYAWNRLVDPNTDSANPSEVSYHISMVDGYDALVAGEKDAKLNLECPDEYTFVVNLNMSYADFPYVVSHLATAPVPEKAAADIDTFKLAPVGNGPFQMKGEWVDGQYIQLERYDGYWGDKAYVDAIDFMIFKDVDTAFTEFTAGNLDYAQIPSGQITTVSEQYGESPDGYTANPGEQALLGSEVSIYYLTCNNEDELMGNKDLRIAISYAIDRQAICDTVFEGTRVPADNFITPGIDGYEEGAWQYSVYDVEKAKEQLEIAKKALGKDEISITLSCNSDGDHQHVMELVQANLKTIGITAEIQTQEWATYLTSLADGDYQIGRLGWVADYPIMDNFLFPMFYTGNGDNRSKYSSAEVDEALTAARSTVDSAERIAALQEVNRTIAEDFPVIPIMFYRHTAVCSDRVHDMYLSPMKLSDLSTCWLSA